MIRRTSCAGPLVAAIALALGDCAGAATITVNQDGDTHVSGRCSLREAIWANNEQAVPADTNCVAGSGSNDVIAIPFATITLTQGYLGIARAVEIKGTLAQRTRIVRDASAAEFGLFRSSAATTFRHVTLSGGAMPALAGIGGGGAILATASVTLIDSVVSGNRSQKNGGGIYSTKSLTLLQSTVSGNQAQGNGGGIAAKYDIAIRDSTIAGNSAGDSSNAGSGGGIAFAAVGNLPARFEMRNSTVSGNDSRGNGGGILLGSGLSAVIGNSTIESNRAYGTANGGGIFADAPLSLTLSSTLVSGNVLGKYEQNIAASAAISVSGSRNLVRAAASGVTLPGGTLACLPALGTLSDNGGPTPTVPLRPGPCAIDAGLRNSLEYDQRGPGYTRVAGMAADIGAFEYSDVIFANGFDPPA